jgi:hypothetical protein
MTLTVSPSTDYLVSYGLNMLHYYLRKYYLIIKFYQTNSQNTWDATGHCFRLTLNKNETKTAKSIYSVLPELPTDKSLFAIKVLV